MKERRSYSLKILYWPITSPIFLYCEASNDGVGAVITHVLSDKSERPILFTFQFFKKHEAGNSNIDREVLAIYYLFARHF